MINSGRRILIIVQLFALIFICCETKEFVTKPVIAVDKISMQPEEFRNTYTLDPEFPGGVKGETGLFEYSNLIIDQILSNMRAEKENLWQQEWAEKQLNYYSQKRLIRALYRRKISSTVKDIQSVELKGNQNSAAEYSVVNIFSAKAENLKSIKRISSGVNNSSESFSEIDSSVVQIADLGWVTIGELEIELENELIRLTPGVFSPIIRSKWGYHLLYLRDKREKQFANVTELVQFDKKIKKRKRIQLERKTAQNYLDETLTPLQIVVKKEAFKHLARVVAGLSSDQPVQTPVQQTRPFSDTQMDFVIEQIKINRQSEILIATSQQNWTILQFLNLWKMIPAEQRKLPENLSELKDQIGLILRDYYLAEAGKDNNCEEDAIYLNEVQRFKEKLAYQYFRQKLIRGLNTDKSVISELRQSLREEFKSSLIKIDSSFIRREAAQIDWANPVRMIVTEQNF